MLSLTSLSFCPCLSHSLCLSVCLLLCLWMSLFLPHSLLFSLCLCLMLSVPVCLCLNFYTLSIWNCINLYSDFSTAALWHWIELNIIIIISNHVHLCASVLYQGAWWRGICPGTCWPQWFPASGSSLAQRWRDELQQEDDDSPTHS